MTELELTKAKLGITSDARDEYIQALIDSIKSDWENHQGIRGLDYSRADVLDLVADSAAYRYNTHDPGPMPRHLQYRLRSLWIKHAGTTQEVADGTPTDI